MTPAERNRRAEAVVDEWESERGPVSHDYRVWLRDLIATAIRKAVAADRRAQDRKAREDL